MTELSAGGENESRDPGSEQQFFAAVDMVSTKAALRLDEVHQRLATTGLELPAPPTVRWHRLLDQLAPGFQPRPGHQQAGPITDQRVRRMVVTAAAFFAAEAIELSRQAEGLPEGHELLATVDAVVAEVTAASRALLAMVAEAPAVVVRAAASTAPLTRLAIMAERSRRAVVGLSAPPPAKVGRAMYLPSGPDHGGPFGRHGPEWSQWYSRPVHGRSRPGGWVAASTPGSVSGLGADPLTGAALARQVDPPLPSLPLVRGRDSLVAELVALLTSPVEEIQVLVGAAGCGKSTVVLAVAREAKRRGLPVWWVSARDRNQLMKGMLAIATELDATSAEKHAMQVTPEDGIDLLWRRLNGCAAPWLMILDDADDLEVLSTGATCWIRPSSAGTLLVTSRVGDPVRWGADTRLIDVPDLDPDAGAQVVLDRMRSVRRSAGDPVEQARVLSERLGGVALALRNAGSYLGSSVAGHSVAELADAIEPGHVATGREDQRHRIEIIREMSLAALADNGVPEARTLLRLLSYYAPHRIIPFEVLTGDRLASLGLHTGSADPARTWASSLRRLQEVGLIDSSRTVGQGVAGVAIHPLVAGVSREDRREAHTVDQIEEAAVELLLQATANLDPGRPADWPAIRRLEMHVYAVLDQLRSTRPGIIAAASALANRVAAGLIRAGLFVLGEQLIRHCQERTGSLDLTDPAHLAAEHTLAWALGLRGQLAEAEEKFGRLLEHRLQVSGPHDPGTLAARDCQAWMLAERGRVVEAQQRFTALLPDRQRHLGSNHPETLATRHRLAWIAALQGRLDEAEYELRRVLTDRERVLGADHMDVFGSRYRLAWVLAWRGQFDDAEVQFQKLRTDLERVLEPDHAATIMVRSRLAWILAARGRLDQAEAAYRNVIADRERVLGHDHHRTLRARHDLAGVLTRRGAHDEAEALYRTVLTDRERVLGADNLHTLNSRGALATLLIERGRLEEAETQLRELLRHREEVIGPDHRATLATRYELGKALLRRGQLGAAEKMFSGLLVDQRRVLGPHHRHTLDTRDGLAEVLGHRGALDEAEHQIRQVLHDRAHFLGKTDPATLTGRGRLAWILTVRGRFADAEDVYRRLLPKRERLLGTDHPDSLTTRYRIAWMYSLAGRDTEAIPLYRSVLLDQHDRLGPDHPHSLRTRGGLAASFLRTGQLTEAQTYYDRLYPDRTRVLGSHHPETLATRHGIALLHAERGQLIQANQALRRLLTDHHAALDPHHPATMTVRENLARILSRQGQHAVAARMWQQLTTEREHLLGLDHPDTCRSHAGLNTDTPFAL